MTGYNVVHAMGYDAFGLPAEEHARQTGEHPRTNTEANIKNYRRQLRALGLGHDTRRSIATTDPEFYRWTQWIFLEIFNSWYDIDADRARPIEELIAEFESGERSPSTEAVWAEMSASERQSVIADHRLAYIDEAPVNWCPELGTVLANEEVTADGRSDRGKLPGVQASVATMEDAHHGLCRSTARRSRDSRLAAFSQADATELDRTI